MLSFEITDSEAKRIRKWLMEEVYPKEIQKQKDALGGSKPDPWVQDCWDDGYPYEGAIAGGVTYEFTPNSIGLSTWVRYGQDYKLDLTDYDLW